MVRGKFKLESSVTTDYGSTYKYEELNFAAVYDDGVPENRRFAKATPSGSLKIRIDNPAAREQFAVGKHYYLDLTPCEEEPPRTPAEAVDPAA